MVSLIFTFQHNYPGSSDCVPGLKTCMEHVLCVFLHAFFSSPMSVRLCVCVCLQPSAKSESEGGNEEHFLLEEPYLTQILPSSLREKDGKGHCKKGPTLQTTEITCSFQMCFKGKFQICRAESPVSCIKGITATQIKLTIKKTFWGLKLSGKPDAPFLCNSKDNSKALLSWCNMLFCVHKMKWNLNFKDFEEF